jgi:hypothetical protein
MRHGKKRDDAARRLPVSLRLHRLRRTAAPKEGTLLRVLLVWLGAVPASPGGGRHGQLLRTDGRLHGAPQHPNSPFMIGRRFRPLFGALVALVLLGMPVVAQALMPAACECMQEISTAPQPCADHSSAPCKGIAATCGAMSCVSMTSLPGQEISTTVWLAWSQVDYLSGLFLPYGHATKPILGPPITI